MCVAERKAEGRRENRKQENVSNFDETTLLVAQLCVSVCVCGCVEAAQFQFPAHAERASHLHNLPRPHCHASAPPHAALITSLLFMYDLIPCHRVRPFPASAPAAGSRKSMTLWLRFAGGFGVHRFHPTSTHSPQAGAERWRKSQYLLSYK